MKQISCIGFEIPSNENNLELDSLSSLSETDIAVFAPDFDTTFYSTGSYKTYEGKELYDKESSVEIIKHSDHWKKEIKYFVENGGTIFVILTEKKDFFIHTGQTKISGTGRNQSTTNMIMPFSNYNFLPFRDIHYHSAKGQTVFPNRDIIKDLYKNIKELVSYETYIESDKIKFSYPIFTTKNKDRVLGTIIKIGKGYIVFLPNIEFDYEKYTKYNSKTEDEWTPEALKIGKSLLTCLYEIDNSIRSKEEKTPKPNWVDNEKHMLSESKKTMSLIKKNEEEIEKKRKEIEQLKVKLEEQECLKDLLFETGKPLENAVIKALNILGYKAESYNDGVLELDQVITAPENERYIGECEGKENKDIDITKFRQLSESLNADFAREDVQEKAFGLLFGNPQRLLSPEERTLNFTKKCVIGAERDKIGLIKTEDLFYVCKHILETNDKNYAAECRNAIKQQLGKIVVFPNHSYQKTTPKS